MKIAIIGAGIVGSTVAYYLHRSGIADVTIFDDGHGQATKAAAGIICPWFSKRRNKAWYQLASQGASFYQTLVRDLAEEGIKTSFYQQNGVYLLKKDDSKLEALKALAESRRQEAPLIGDVRILDKEVVAKEFPGLEGFQRLLFAEGGARVDGAELCQTLLKATPYQLVTGKVSLITEGKVFTIQQQSFDHVFLCAGAWLGQVLEPLGYQVDIRPQKGQLIDYQLRNLVTDQLPVVMPEGEIDLIPFFNGHLAVGASHENDQAFDLSVDEDLLIALEESAQAYYPELNGTLRQAVRVGTRAYSSDFLPFFGEVPGMKGIFAASGLGSSGLTVGPLIGRELVALLLQDKKILDMTNYPIQNYVKYSKM
ncbi:NAD(P)/FAD-dependent oxidoreductase [Streptococcus pseudoporcinus]|uniref:FAD dependent oxidoreductase n=1 Tax=Streptococcus pseudoporcinus LQ 940-04 TaxID=875093 RepID=G5KAU0_9STRE|nr:FAD-dependent oxidoreductase [Streptococcus pseudoporcinus]EFR44608.1 FAD dependent oxidoreductase [Streptococcus pseudoporcinus SPIN 20026]EHI65397.1 FAD dependent oxidoreductase [Streptococcus pseudoporcinus LQ 940-04]VEF93168.1 FAD dependent oxidoreductase [Streptococcus pseudoporcinus]